jgi:hypothetical protein
VRTNFRANRTRQADLPAGPDAGVQRVAVLYRIRFVTQANAGARSWPQRGRGWFDTEKARFREHRR